MKHLTFLATVVASFVLASCASQSAQPSRDNSQQMATINLWHQCVDNNLEILASTSSAPAKLTTTPAQTIQKTLVACEGYQRDVLDTFPQHLHKSLGNIMVKQVYESGYTKYAERNGLALPITAVTFDELRRNHFKPVR